LVDVINVGTALSQRGGNSGNNASLVLAKNRNHTLHKQFPSKKAKINKQNSLVVRKVSEVCCGASDLREKIL
jgi:hypothetical protein